MKAFIWTNDYQKLNIVCPYIDIFLALTHPYIQQRNMQV